MTYTIATKANGGKFHVVAAGSEAAICGTVAAEWFEVNTDSYSTVAEAVSALGHMLCTKCLKVAAKTEEPATEAVKATECGNVQPLPVRISQAANFAMSDFGICPDCGRWLVVLPSGVFRRHKPRFKAGSVKIASEIARYRETAAPYVAANGNRFTPEQAKLITEPLQYRP